MGAFKKGDRVRMERTGPYDGATGVVVEVEEWASYRPIRFKCDEGQDFEGFGDTHIWADAKELKLAHAFKVGDRVRVLADGFGRAESGQKGTVAEIDQLFVGVEMDAPFDGHGKSGHRWNFFHADEELVAVAPQLQRPTEPQLTIQAGKFYKTRDGRKVGPMQEWCDWVEHTMGADGVREIWRPDGTSDYNADLIAEWVDEPAVAQPVAEQPAAKPKFKVGGIIVATCSVADITEGQIYVVQDIDEDDDVMPVCVTDDVGDRFWMDVDYFRVHESTSTPAIVCLMEDGRPLPAERPHVHTSTSAAEREAARLADKYKGKEFAVFELGSSCRKEPEYAHEWQRLAAAGKRDDAAAELHRLTGMAHSYGRFIADRYAA